MKSQTKLNVHIRSEQGLESGADIDYDNRERFYGGNQGPGGGRLSTNRNTSFPSPHLHLPPTPHHHHHLERDSTALTPSLESHWI